MLPLSRRARATRSPPAPHGRRHKTPQPLEKGPCGDGHAVHAGESILAAKVVLFLTAIDM
jgi:hypothetical protein